MGISKYNFLFVNFVCAHVVSGTSNAKAGELATVKVVTYDNEGHRHAQGGEDVTAEISTHIKPSKLVSNFIES